MLATYSVYRYVRIAGLMSPVNWARRKLARYTPEELLAAKLWSGGDPLRAIHTLRVHAGYDNERIKQWLRFDAKVSDDYVVAMYAKLGEACDTWCVNFFQRKHHKH